MDEVLNLNPPFALLVTFQAEPPEQNAKCVSMQESPQSAERKQKTATLEGGEDGQKQIRKSVSEITHLVVHILCPLVRLLPVLSVPPLVVF